MHGSYLRSQLCLAFQCAFTCTVVLGAATAYILRSDVLRVNVSLC